MINPGPLITELIEAADKLGVALILRTDDTCTPLNNATFQNPTPPSTLLHHHGAVKDAIEVRADADDPHSHKLLTAFELIADRAAAAFDAEEVNAELADSLSKSFDRADVTMAVAAAQRSVEAPDRFVLAACEEVRSTIGFDWTGILFERAATVPASLADAGLFATSPEWTAHEAQRAAVSLAAGTEADTGPWVAEFKLDNPPVRGAGIMAPIAIEHNVAGMLVGGWVDLDTGSLNSYHLSLAESVCAFLGPFMENLLLHERDRGRFFATLEALSSTLDAKDPYTRGHSERVARLALHTGEALDMSDRELENLEIAGRLHDVGKIGVPEAILLKPDRLTDAEFDEIKRHPTIGYEILKGVPGLEHMLPGVLHHHERWDGKGYPDGLAGKETPFQARILAVADTFDAMSSKRSYRDSLDRDFVLKVIRENRGTQFDPLVTDAFLSIDLSWYEASLARTFRSTTPSDRRAA